MMVVYETRTCVSRPVYVVEAHLSVNGLDFRKRHYNSNISEAIAVMREWGEEPIVTRCRRVVSFETQSGIPDVAPPITEEFTLMELEEIARNGDSALPQRTYDYPVDIK